MALEFLEARVVEDEAAAREGLKVSGGGRDGLWVGLIPSASWRSARRRGSLGNVPLLVTDLAIEVGGTSEYVLMCLAAIYADHPEYQEGWIIAGGP